MKYILSILILLSSFQTFAQQSKFDKSYHRYTSELNKRDTFFLKNDSTLLLTKVAKDSEYGFTEIKPVMLGMAYLPDSAANYREKYLNALSGPNGEMIHFERIAACCVFHTPNQLRHWLTKEPEKSNYGLLERYKIWYEGIEPKILYINIYDEGDVLIPQGFQAKK